MKTSLREFLSGTAGNAARHYATYPQYAAVLEQISSTYGTLLTAAAVAERAPTVFFAMSHGAFLAGCGLALSGQAPPAYMAARGSLESSLYGFWIHRHPEALEIWKSRHDTEETKKAVRDLFKIGAMIKELKTVVPSIGNQFQVSYDSTIDFGGHPNYLAYLTNLENDDQGETRWMSVSNEAVVVKQSMFAVGFCGLSALAVAAATFEELRGSEFAQSLAQVWVSWDRLETPTNGQKA